MIHWRNNMRGRASLRGQQSTDTSAALGKYAPSDSNSYTGAFPPEALVNLRGGNAVSSFIQDERELGAKCFVAGLVAVLGFALFVFWFVISNFVA